MVDDSSAIAALDEFHGDYIKSIQTHPVYEQQYYPNTEGVVSHKSSFGMKAGLFLSG